MNDKLMRGIFFALERLFRSYLGIIYDPKKVTEFNANFGYFAKGSCSTSEFHYSFVPV